MGRAARRPDRPRMSRVFVDAEAGLRSYWRRFLWPTLAVAVCSAVAVAAQVASQGITESVSEELDSVELEHIDGSIELAVLERVGASRLTAAVRHAEGVSAAGLWRSLEPNLVAQFTKGPELVASRVLEINHAALEVLLPEMESGRVFEGWEADGSHRVALIGTQVAELSGYSTAAQRSTIWLDGLPFTVVGVIGNVDGPFELQGSVLVPLGSAPRIAGSDVRITARVEPRVAASASRSIDSALSLVAPDGGFTITAVPDSASLRSVVSDGFVRAFRWTSGAALVFSALATWAASRPSFVSREPEFALRKSLGARRRDLIALFMIEATAVGIAGGAVAVLALAGGLLALQGSGLELSAPIYVVLSPFLIGLLSTQLSALMFVRSVAGLSVAEVFRR